MYKSLDVDLFLLIAKLIRKVGLKRNFVIPRYSQPVRSRHGNMKKKKKKKKKVMSYKHKQFKESHLNDKSLIYGRPHNFSKCPNQYQTNLKFQRRRKNCNFIKKYINLSLVVNMLQDSKVFQVS